MESKSIVNFKRRKRRTKNKELKNKEYFTIFKDYPPKQKKTKTDKLNEGDILSLIKIFFNVIIYYRKKKKKKKKKMLRPLFSNYLLFFIFFKSWSLF